MDRAVGEKAVRVKRIALIFPLLLIGAAPAEDAGIAALVADDARVAAVAWRLQTGAVGLCKTVVPLPGFTVHSLGQYAPADRARVAAALRLGERPAVLAVVPGSSADKEGLVDRQELLVINGVQTAGGLPAKADYGVTAAAEDAVEAALAGGPLVMTVARRGARGLRGVTMTGDRGCASRVQVVPGGSPGAQADGRYVQITSATLAVAKSDDELAALLAHELAHNFLEHRKRLDAQGASRGILRGFGSSGAKWRATEDEADRFGVWIVARGGYSLDAIVPFWTAWAKRRGRNPFGEGTHRPWRERLVLIAAEVAKAKVAKAAGQPLSPAQ